MYTPDEIIEYKGCNVEVYIDNNPINPIEEFELLGTMVCVHSRYVLGHKQYESGTDALYHTLEEILDSNQTMDDDYYMKQINKGTFIEKYMKVLEKHAIVLPLYLLDHSGITISTLSFNDPWDSGQVGFIYVLKKKIREEFKWQVITAKRRERIVEILMNDVETYDCYLRGDVYGYIAKDGDTVIDYCWGYFGNDWNKNGMENSYQSSIDHYIQESQIKEKEQAIKDAKLHETEIGDMSQLILL